MPPPTKVTSRDTLPPLGTLETDRLDFKAKHDQSRSTSDRQNECAKDVAAFANHLGGTILIGAAEVGKVLAKYIGMTATEANDALNEYDLGVRDLCLPKPLVTYDVIPHDDGRVVVAVNVEPRPDQLIGIRRASDTDYWSVPRRVGTHTVCLNPEQQAMLADPRVRRAIILLARISPDELVTVRVSIANHASKNHWISEASIDVVEETNTVRVTRNNGKHDVVECYALDSVRTVYRQANNTWQVVIDDDQRG